MQIWRTRSTEDTIDITFKGNVGQSFAHLLQMELLYDLSEIQMIM